MRVLIGCATSCVALDAFLRRGHDAWQCDLLPADKPTNRHIQDDPRDTTGNHPSFQWMDRADGRQKGLF